MRQRELLNIVAFCILMESNEGIITKPPNYIREKYSRIMANAFTDGEEVWGLDSHNKSKLIEYRKEWLDNKNN